MSWAIVWSRTERKFKYVETKHIEDFDVDNFKLDEKKVRTSFITTRPAIRASSEFKF